MSSAAPTEHHADRLEEPDPDFRMAGDFAVRAVLRESMMRETVFTLHPEGKRADGVPARIVDVDTDRVEFEIPGLTQDAARLCAAGFVIASTAPATIRTQFRIDRLQPVDAVMVPSADPGAVILGAPLPPAVYRCQRRDSFRVRPPAEDHARCVQRAAPGLERRHPVVDLSAGGLSLHLAAGQPVPQPGTIWRHCRLEAGDSVTIPCELIACAAYEDTGTQAGESGDGEGRAPAAGPAGEPRRRIAFAFHRMPAEVLRAVQRYVIDIERRTRASARE